MTDLQKIIILKFGSQSNLADHLGWSRQRVSRIAKGNVIPTLESANQLADALDLTIDELTEKILNSKSTKVWLQSNEKERSREHE